MIGDVAVGPVGLGGASWSFAPDRDRDRAFDTVATAYEAGVRYFDTAAAYTTATEPGAEPSRHNEQLLAEALRRVGDPSDVLVGTKGGHLRGSGDFPIDARPTSLRRDCEGSLTALGTDALDLYFLHWPDPAVPIVESVGALEELRVEGLIKRIGVSNVSLEQLELARSVAEITAVQNSFSPFQTRDRGHPDDLIAVTERLGIAYLVYSPLGGIDRRARADRLPRTAAAAARLAASLAEGAEPGGISVERIILAWELGIAANVIPVTGATRPATVLDSVAAAELALDGATLAAIEADVLAI